MLQLGAGHLVAQCASLPCSSPKCWRLSREIACTILKSLVRMNRISNPHLPHTKRAFYHWAKEAAQATYFRDHQVLLRSTCVTISSLKHSCLRYVVITCNGGIPGEIKAEDLFHDGLNNTRVSSRCAVFHRNNQLTFNGLDRRCATTRHILSLAGYVHSSITFMLRNLPQKINSYICCG